MREIESIRNQIINGDALTMLREFPDECIDACITSPPYFMPHAHKACPPQAEKCEHDFGIPSLRGCDTQSRISLFCIKCGTWNGVLGAESDADSYVKNLCVIFDEVRRVLTPRGICCVIIGDSYSIQGDSLSIPFRFAMEMHRMKWVLRDTLIWVIKNDTCFDYVFIFAKDNSAYFDSRIMNRILFYEVEKMKEYAYGILPLEMANRLVEVCCPQDGIVLDPFCGSGSVLKAAKDSYRKFCGIDMDKKSCEIARERVGKK